MYKFIINDKYAWWFDTLQEACDKLVYNLYKMNAIDKSLSGKFIKTGIKDITLYTTKIYEVETEHSGNYKIFKKSKGLLDPELTLYYIKKSMEKFKNERYNN